MKKKNKNKFKWTFTPSLHIGIGKSLFIWFLLISFVPLVTVSFINYMNAFKSLTNVTNKTLITTSKLRVQNINLFFENIFNDIGIQAKLNSNINFFKSLSKDYQASNLKLKSYVNSKRWKNYSNKKLKELKNISELEGYYDIRFIDKEGNILFSLNYEDDLGTNIYTGKYSKTLFAETSKKALEKDLVLFSDLEYYKPSNNKISGFIIKSMKDSDDNIFGLIAYQISSEQLNTVMQRSVGIGKTGLAFIIGPDQFLRTSTSTFYNDSILQKKINTVITRNWKNFYTRNKVNYNTLTDSLYKNDGKLLAYKNAEGIWVYGLYMNLKRLSDYGIHWAIFEEFDHSEAFLYNKELLKTVKISLIITLIIVFVLSLIISMRFVYPLKELSAWAKQVARGELKNKDIWAPKNEVGEMKDAFNNLVHSLQEFSKISQLIAFGDFSQKFKIRSKHDVLGISINQVVDNFREVVKQSNEIAGGNYSNIIKPRSKNDTLGIALYEMTKTLKESSEEINRQDWIKTGTTNLNDKISGIRNLSKLSDVIISFITRYLKSEIGLLYILEKDDYLKLYASYSFYDKENKFKRIKIGEGLVGQAAKEKRIIEYDNVNKNLPKLNYGVDEKIPEHFIFAPFIYENEFIGVLQLGASEKFDETKKLFLGLALDIIAVSISSAQSNAKLQNLLSQTQEQKEKLQVQQEELRQTNEELELQTQALKASEETLQVQKEELSVSNEELEKRTHDLEIEKENINKKNEELKIAQKEIEGKAKALALSSKYKSEFLANMSHELRTPLNSILVMSQLLVTDKNKNLTEKQLQFAKTIFSSGTDLLNLINDILDLSKVESGKVQANIEVVKFSLIKEQLEKVFIPLVKDKNIDFSIDIDENLPEDITTDSQKLLQILKNLLSNAIKFTEKGRVTLKICRPYKKSILKNLKFDKDKAVAFEVSDTGIGISEEKAKIIFEAFQQADGTTSRKYGGTGLGLSISRSYSHLLNGDIFLESKINKGSVFTVVLPEKYEKLADDNQNIDDAEKPEKIESDEIKSPAKDKDIKSFKQTKLPDNIIDDRNFIKKGDKFLLIIEDDPAFNNVLYDLAKDKGFKTMIAVDGETGLYFADYYSPSAIILDIGLPGIDGWEVITRLKANPKTKNIPIHCITASDKKDKAFNMGAAGFLHKPVSIEALDKVLKKIKLIISKSLKKILIIDDEEIIRKSILSLTKNDSIDTTAVDNGTEALKLLDENNYDAVILDLGLNDMSGFDILEKIRKDKKIAKIPVIIYTGKELNKKEEEKLQKYANSIIVKGPRSLERLSDEVKLFLYSVDKKSDKQKNKKNLPNNGLSSLHNKKVLLVDDDMRNVFALTNVLEEHGLKVIVGRNGVECLEQLKQNPDVNIVLMDIMMPVMDGFEAMKHIRKDVKYAKLPIIAITAKAMKGDREKCIAAGATEYLPKPVDVDRLISLLRVWLFK